MTNDRKMLLVAGVVALAVLSAIILFGNRAKQPIGSEQMTDKKKETTAPPSSEEVARCGIESCHGLDITCGEKIPEACDMMYSPVDNCRQYASCQIVDGQCTLQKHALFEQCQSCMEKCKKDFASQTEKVFGCQSACANND